MLAGLPPRSFASAPIYRRGALVSGLAGIRAVLGAWRQRYRYRRELRRLISSGPHLIEDIGLSRAHADREIAKPFWRP
jgi:uncharacterized protein YjiS (DUF1127 family)